MAEILDGSEKDSEGMAAKVHEYVEEYRAVSDAEDGLAALRMYAGHFYPRDWAYTTDLGPLEAIRYSYPSERFWGRQGRLWSALEWLGGNHDNIVMWFSTERPLWKVLRGRWQMFLHCLKREDHLPDGTLDGGKIIAIWEEDGEYLNLMQPTTGLLVADLLEADPEDSEAVRAAQAKVIAELDRLQTDYAKRRNAECDREDCERHG